MWLTFKTDITLDLDEYRKIIVSRPNGPRPQLFSYIHRGQVQYPLLK